MHTESSDFSYPPSNRLRKSKEIKLVGKEGLKLVTPFFIVLATRRRCLARDSRLGLIVTKKIGKAHIRNQLKRRFREIFRLTKNDWQGFDILLIGRHRAVGATVDEMKQAFSSSMTKLQKRSTLQQAD